MRRPLHCGSHKLLEMSSTFQLYFKIYLEIRDALMNVLNAEIIQHFALPPIILMITNKARSKS